MMKTVAVLLCAVPLVSGFSVVPPKVARTSLSMVDRKFNENAES